MAGISHEAIPPKLDSLEPEAGGLPAGVKVKPLEWVRPQGSDSLRRAETVFGPYRTWSHFEASGEWFWSLDGYEKTSASGWSEAEVRAAAQTDYERRILSAIEVVPIRAMELRRYIERCKELSAQGEYTWWSRLAEILSALSASPAPVAVPAGYRLVEGASTPIDDIIDRAANKIAFDEWFKTSNEGKTASDVAKFSRRVRGFLLEAACELAEPYRVRAEKAEAMLAASPVPSTATQAGAVSAELLSALKAIAEGYSVTVWADRWIRVQNPEYRPDNGSDPGLVIDTAALASSPETARDRAERRVAELDAAGLHTLGDIERAQSSGELRKKLEAAWTDFCDANPDDLTSPDDLPDHALMTCQQFVDYAISVVGSQAQSSGERARDQADD